MARLRLTLSERLGRSGEDGIRLPSALARHAGHKDRHAVPGMVVSIQTYGDQAANWQPHLHALVTAGVVDGAGAFTPPPPPPAWPRSCSSDG